MDATGGHHRVANLQGLDQLLVLLGAFLLGPDEQKVKDGEHDHQHDDPLVTGATTFLAGGCGHGESF